MRRSLDAATAESRHFHAPNSFTRAYSFSLSARPHRASRQYSAITDFCRFERLAPMEYGFHRKADTSASLDAAKRNRGNFRRAGVLDSAVAASRLRAPLRCWHQKQLPEIGNQRR